MVERGTELPFGSWERGTPRNRGKTTSVHKEQKLAYSVVSGVGCPLTAASRSTSAITLLAVVISELGDGHDLRSTQCAKSGAQLFAE
jgi:hypothetical protein